MSTTPRPVTEADLLNLCAKLAEKNAAYFAKHYANLTPGVFYPDKGRRKYVRIVRADADGGGRSVVCFIELATGLIWKAAGWKAPEKNFPRGSIHDPNRLTEGENIYGCLYGR